jgi:flagellar hook-basal body complex protein FliE
MSVEAIGPAFLPLAEDLQSPQADAPARAFSTWLDEQIRTANTEIISADDSVRRLAVGEPVNLHQVMVQLERARMQFELILQVRNKLLDAYQDLLRMQI